MTEYRTIPKKRRNIIKYFIFVFFIIPTIQTSGLTQVVGRVIPNPLGYSLLAFILSLPLLRSYSQRYGNLKGVVFAITLLIAYIFITFFSTITKTSLYETVTVFRHSHMQALNLFILLPFMFTLSKEEINYTLRNIFKCLIIFIMLYLSNNLIYDWMGVKGNLIEDVGGASMDRSIIGLPLLDPIWSALLIMYAIMKVPKVNKYLALILLALIISFTRNTLFSTIIIAATIMMLTALKNPRNIERSFKITSLLLIVIAAIAILMPDAINYWIAKISSTFNDDLKHDIGTFAFRERLIENAIYAIRHDPLFGLGYVRDVAKGEYSIVMGGDTYIAPILWCEGWIGLILRSLPFILLGLSAFSNIFVRKRGYWLDIVIIASIVAMSVNYVQTKALTNYTLILGILILLKIKDNYDRKATDKSNINFLI